MQRIVVLCDTFNNKCDNDSNNYNNDSNNDSKIN